MKTNYQSPILIGRTHLKAIHLMQPSCNQPLTESTSHPVIEKVQHINRWIKSLNPDAGKNKLAAQQFSKSLWHRSWSPSRHSFSHQG